MDSVTGSTAVWLPLLVTVAALSFWICCLVDFTQADEREMRTFTKPVWLVILIFGSVAGGLAWLLLGRPERPSLRR
jgi:uncharacterized membrane protein YsdA (DUF1294 family)